MYVSQLVVNDVSIPIGLSKPTGLEKPKASLERDFVYSGIDTKIDVELSFYCDNGKEAIDAEYESNGVEGTGYVEITDICGETELVTRFKLDFRKYSTNSDKCSVGLEQLDLIEGGYVNWKEDLREDVNLSQIVGLEQDFYVRNLPLKYYYYSSNLNAKEIASSSASYIYEYEEIVPPNSFYLLSLYPKTNVSINELEEGSELLAETLSYTSIINGSYYDVRKSGVIRYEDRAGVLISSASLIRENYYVSDIEPNPIFENTLDDGIFTIDSTGDSRLQIDFTGFYELQFDMWEVKEIVLVGKKWGQFSKSGYFDNLCGYFKQIEMPSVLVNPIVSNPVGGSPSNYSLIFDDPAYTVQSTIFQQFPVKKDEKVWIYYQVLFKEKSGIFKFKTSEYTYTLNRYYNIEFTLSKKTTPTLISSSDIEPYHTKVKAYQGRYALNEIFKTNYNIAYSNCYNDLWFTKGDKLRNKINSADFIVKPSDFFRELEKVVCCGLGIFYDSSGNPSKELRSVFEFYTDNLQNIFQESDIIDGDIKIEPYPSVFFKDIQIGYSNSKDSPYELSKQNDYSIDNISTNSYSKVSNFIASQYIITKAMKLGAEDKEREFDKNIFILSGTEDSGYNVTLSQTSGYLADNILVNTNNIAGINRRYATVLNLFRHLYKWGFSLFAGKEKLTANKYEGNSIYTKEIRDTVGSSTNPYYPGLSPCMLPLDKYVKTDKTIDDIYLHIQSDLYVPSVITFKTNKYTSVSLLNSRNTQYDLYKVTANGVDYYGNLISAILEDDVTEIKLLRRFKNGI